MKTIISILVLMLIISIVGISECTSTGNNSTGNQNSSQGYQNDIKVGAASYDYFPQDGSASGGCAVTNEGSVTYKQVKINLEIYDENGTVVGNETRAIGQIRPGEDIGYFVITEKAFPKGKSASATIVGATSVT